VARSDLPIEAIEAERLPKLLRLPQLLHASEYYVQLVIAATVMFALALHAPFVLGATTTAPVQQAQSTLVQAQQIRDWTVKHRRALHEQPELLYNLSETSKYVRGVLDSLHIPYQYPVAQQGIVATIGSGESPCVALRADMDALPIHEELTLDFRSRTDGKMHACGHDAHTSMLLTAARLLKEREESLPGTVKLIFQPAEEGGAGGLAMLEAGVLTAEPQIERIFALHVWPGLPAGTVGGREGTLMAAAGFFHARFVGHGGHAAMPHTTTDPFMAVGAALSGLQTVVARNLAPTEAGVVSTTFVHGGSAYNIIPGTVEMGGTLRSLTREGYGMLHEKTAAVLRGAAATFGCALNLTVSSFDHDCLRQPPPEGAPGSCTFPPTVNHPNGYATARAAALGLVGDPERVIEMDPTMGGEDFAYFLEHVPGAMMFLGIGNATAGTDVNLHNPRFRMDEAQMPLGAALHVEMALRALRELSQPDASKLGCSRVAGQGPQCGEGTYIEAED